MTETVITGSVRTRAGADGERAPNRTGPENKRAVTYNLLLGDGIPPSFGLTYLLDEADNILTDEAGVSLVVTEA